MIELALLAVAATIGGGAILVRQTLGRRRRDAQLLGLLATFGPACERARSDPRVLLAWYPTALAARRAFPQAFRVLDGDGQCPFPFGPAELEAAHARWSTEWLDWERRQDADHRARRETVEAELAQAGDAVAPMLRARLEALEQQKLEQYQHRYEEYVRVSRELKALSETEPAANLRQPSRPSSRA